MVQLSQPYVTTGKTIALTVGTFVGRVMSLLFNILSRSVIAFWLRSSHFLITYLQSPFAVILEPKKRESVTSSTSSPSICHEVTGLLSVQFSSVAQLCPTLCDPMNRSTPGLPVHHQLPEFTQTHVHRVRDAIQPSHPLMPSTPALSLSQHQGLFQ